MSNRTDNNTISIRISRDDLSRRILVQLMKRHELPLDELSQATGAGVADMAPALDFLEAKSYIRQSTPAPTKATVALRQGKNCIVGLDLGGTKLYGAVCDLTGAILHDQEVKIQSSTGEACLDLLAGLIEQLIAGADRRNLKVQGIGVDVPGRVQLDTGLVVNAPAVGMRNFPLKERLVARFGYPVFIDNDLKQASLGEAWFGLGRNYRHVVLLAIGTGIAAGMVVDGYPLRGAHERLGELGWMVPGPDFLGRKYVGFGALETEASGPGIIDRARRLLSGTEDAKFLEELSGETVFAAAKSGAAWAEQCVAETVDFLAVLIANIMAFYDPDIIILSGGVSRSSDMLIPPILKQVEGCVLTQPILAPSELGYKAGALGGLINIVQNCPEFFS